MGPDSLRFEELLMVARRHGVTSFKYGDVSADLGHPPLPADRNLVIGDEEVAPTEDQLLFWSTGLAPEHKAEAPNDL